MPQNENTSMIESFDQVKDTLPGAWLLDTRSNAIRSFEAQGYLTPRTEEWKHTNLNRLAREGFHPASDIGSPDVSDWSDLRVNGSSRIVILNGGMTLLRRISARCPMASQLRRCQTRWKILPRILKDSLRRSRSMGAGGSQYRVHA